MKLHLACGDVYLKGYVNIDIGHSYARDYSTREMRKIGTDIENYYKDKTIGCPQKIIIDKFGSITDKKFWDDFDTKSIEEVVMINAIEHFTLKEAEFIVYEIWRVLKDGGLYILDYPNLTGIIEARGMPIDYKMRLIYGSERNKHYWGYGDGSVRELLRLFKSVEIGKTIVKHPYPSVGVIAEK